MKIAVLTLNHVYANRILKDLINKFGNNIKLIVEPKTQSKGKTNIQVLYKYIRTSGIYYTIIQTIKLLIFKALSPLVSIFGNEKNKFYSYKKLASKKRIGMFTEEDVNSRKFKKKLKKVGPDLVVSVLFSQILKSDLINIPRKGVINIHPAYLPDYKGISPVFWALTNKEKYSGVTTHYIDEGIDTGNIIYQKKIKIDPKDTEDSLYEKAVKAGSPLLIKAIRDIEKNKVESKKIRLKGSYYSFPTKKTVKQFRRNRRKFFILSDYLKHD